MLQYLTFSLSICFISWIAGMLLGTIISKTPYRGKYFAHLNFITHPRLNQLMGIDAFKWIIQNSFFKFFNPKLSMPKTIRPGELQDLRDEMTTAELNHLLAFIAVLVYAVIPLCKGRLALAVVMMIVNVLMNLYPVLLQQQNKRRIDRYLNLIGTNQGTPV